MEINDVLSYLGFKEDQFKTIDEFKDAYNKDYIKRSIAEKDDDIITKITGKFAGSTLTAIKRMAKAANITLEKDILENKKVEDIIDHIGDNLGKSIETMKGDYETKLKSTETDALKDWKEKYEKLESKHKDTDQMVKTMKLDLSKKDDEYKGKIKSYKIGDSYKSAMGSIKFATTVDELRKKGFEAVIADKYELDLDESENVFPKDKKTGQRIPSPTKNGEFLNVGEVLAMEAEQNNLTQKNNAGSNNFGTFANNGNQQQQQQFKVGDEPKDLRSVPASQRK